MTIQQEIVKPSLGAIIEMYIIDGTKHGVQDKLYVCPTTDAGKAVQFGGFTFMPVPLESKGWSTNQNGAPPRPTLSISNVTRFILPYIINHKDMVGWKVTRIRTIEKFLDGRPTADFNQRFPDQEFWIEQKLSHTADVITWELASILDTPGIKLPRRQVLRDGSRGMDGFPGVSRIRLN